MRRYHANYPRANRGFSQVGRPSYAQKVARIDAPSAELRSFVENYKASYRFMLEMHREFVAHNGQLTPKQWDAVQKCWNNELRYNTVQHVDLMVDIPCKITVSAARRLMKEQKLQFSPTTLRITRIHGKRHNRFEVSARIEWSGNASVCRCCSKTLKDWRSQATGVGPVCVKRTNIPYVTDQADVARFQRDMEQLAASIGEFRFSIAAWNLWVDAASPIQYQTTHPVWVALNTHFEQAAKTGTTSAAVATPQSTSQTKMTPKPASTAPGRTSFEISELKWWEFDNMFTLKDGWIKDPVNMQRAQGLVDDEFTVIVHNDQTGGKREFRKQDAGSNCAVYRSTCGKFKLCIHI